jgi:hypothetical protein
MRAVPGSSLARSAHRRNRLRGWGGRTRTAESVGIEVRPCCRGISADLAEMAQQRRFAFELRRYQRAAAARIWPGGRIRTSVAAKKIVPRRASFCARLVARTLCDDICRPRSREASAALWRSVQGAPTRGDAGGFMPVPRSSRFPIAKAKTSIARIAIAPITLAAVIGGAIDCSAFSLMAALRPFGLKSLSAFDRERIASRWTLGSGGNGGNGAA